MKILFLHGWRSVPGGVKPTYLVQHGYDVVNPALDDDDFEAAVAAAQAEFNKHRPQVVVGSSRGGAIAMNIDSGEAKLVLLCPAWKNWGTAKTVKPGTVIIHSQVDDVIPFCNSEELIHASHLSASALIEVGKDHRLADPEPLDAMLAACGGALLSAMPCSATPVPGTSEEKIADRLPALQQVQNTTRVARTALDPVAHEWKELHDWYSIYQWPRVAAEPYTEQIASLIVSEINNIQLVVNGLRQDTFRVNTHQGQAQLQNPIEQFTEKRFLRAMFNCPEPTTLGRAIDYEIPLKQNRGAPHGDIDLLCLDGSIVFIVEAKQPGSTESILKGILQAFVYASLVSQVRDTFLRNFGLDSNSKLTPAILTFPTAISGTQLERMDEYPELRNLIRALNGKLQQENVAPLRFFVVDDDPQTIPNCLTTKTERNGHVKVIFRDRFVPKIREVFLT